jgi:hypothetical protein
MTEIHRCDICGMGDGRAGVTRPSRSRVYRPFVQVLDGITPQIIYLDDAIAGQYLAYLDDVASPAFRARIFRLARWAHAAIIEFTKRHHEHLPATPRAG